MEMINSLIGMPYVFHCMIVSVVLLGAVLLFIFSMKPAEEPNFKIKGDSKPNNKKKKGKENKKIASNGLSNAVDFKSSKSSANAKVRSPKSEDKGKKTNALKESKNVNITSAKNVKKDSAKNENKKKGKENIESNASYSDEEGVWEQALSRKDKKKKISGLKEDFKAKQSFNSPTTEGKKQLYDGVKDKSTKKEKKQKLIDNLSDDAGWQEAKSSKKRRKIQKEA